MRKIEPVLLPKLVEEYQKLKKAQELLTSIWSRMNPYDRVHDQDTMRELRDYFGFDDSE